MESLENHALGEIQNGRDADEEIVQRLSESLTTANPVPTDLSRKVYAAHMVAAATMAALAQGANIPALFQRMLDLLKQKHDTNPTFGPLLVRRPGNISRDRAYVPFRSGSDDVADARPTGRRKSSTERRARRGPQYLSPLGLRPLGRTMAKAPCPRSVPVIKKFDRFKWLEINRDDWRGA